MNGFVRVFALLPGLVLTTELLNRAGADWFGAYIASVLTVCLSVVLSERYIIAPETALTAELVFSSVFIMGLGHGAAKVILLLGALLALPVGNLLTRCTERLRRIILFAALLGLSLLLLSESGRPYPTSGDDSQSGGQYAGPRCTGDIVDTAGDGTAPVWEINRKIYPCRGSAVRCAAGGRGGLPRF